MKRRIFKLCSFLLLGAIVNVAVAWACALAAGSEKLHQEYVYGLSKPQSRWPVLDETHREQASAEDLRWLKSEGWTPKLNLPQISDETLWHCQFDSFGFIENAYEEVSASDNLRNFSATFRVAGDTVQTGWPMVTMRESSITDRSDRLIERHSLPMPNIFHLFPLQDGYRIPIAPIWPAFAFNTVIYALAIWLVCFLPVGIRRMIRTMRGLCPACAYPIGSSAVCTECGKPMKPRNVQAT